ncbi:MAG: hypothetical protein HY858_02385 [Candidatus Solibacter usitatus]|nr:hypothetical protein [Candidatus Solibacter usitatus]
MRYWAYLLSKTAAAGAVLWLVWKGMYASLPEPETFLYTRVSRFPQDLGWTSALLGFWLLSVGAAYLIVWDQRRRCRTCLRRLRMPVERGSWGLATLLNPPRLESICPYGHGTMESPEVHVTGAAPPQWHSHGNMWRELEKRDSGRK